MSKDYEVGYPRIDRQHKDFFMLLATFQHTPTSLFFERLEQHLIAHFEDENRLMTETKYFDMKRHVEEHKRMVEELKVVKHHRYEQIKFYVEDTLPKWFDDHWNKMDKATALYIKRMKTSQSRINNG